METINKTYFQSNYFDEPENTCKSIFKHFAFLITAVCLIFTKSIQFLCGPVSFKQGSLFFQNGLPNMANGMIALRNQDSSFPEPIGKGRSSSIGSSNGLERSRSLSGTGSTGGIENRTRSLSGASSSTGEYGRAPGSEREDIHVSNSGRFKKFEILILFDKM